jgi:hypothetical protein
MDISLKLNSISLAVIQTFSPARLFAAGEQGAWYDPSDLNTLFQDQAGTTPVTAVEQPVSLMLDKSKGGGAIGADTVVNGTFAADSDWTKGTDWSIGSGVATKTAGTAAVLSQSATLTVGRSYLITYTITRTAGTLTGQLTGGTTVSGTARSAAGTYTDMLTAVSGNNAIAFSADASFAGTVDNVTLRLLPAGNHAYTPSTATASRPVLSARVNLLEKTEQFDDAYWTKIQLTVDPNVTATTDPLGGSTADKLIENTANSARDVRRTLSNSSGSYIFSCYMKYNGRIGRLTLASNSNSDFVLASFDLQAGTATTTTAQGGWTNTAANIVNVGDGWYLCSIFGTSSTTLSLAQIRPVDSASNSSGLYTGDGTSGLYIWGADLRVSNDGVGIPSYQRVDTSTSYDTVGFPLYLRADGTDDYMLTNSINFTATDKMTVWAGVRKLSNTPGYQILNELSANVGTNNGTFFSDLNIDFADPDQALGFGSRGAGLGSGVVPVAAALLSSFPTPTSLVMSGIGNISGDSVVLRLNGSQIASNTDNQGTGNYGNHPLYLFRRAGTSFPFNGRCYGLIVRGAQSSTAQIQQGESYMNQLTKAY